MVDLWAPMVRTVLAPVWARWEGSPYLRHYRALLRTQYDPPDVIRSRQWEAVSELLRHAYQTTTFWQQRLDEAGLDPDDLKSFEDYRAVPLLTKQHLRSHGRALISRQCDPAKQHHRTTSGSTGVSVEVWLDDQAQQWQRACTLRSDTWTGWRLGERVGMVWGNPEYLRRGWRGRLRNRLLERAQYLDTLKMNEATMDHFARSLSRRPPAILFGHAHSLYLFAQFVRSRGGAGFRPRGIISSAMVLHEWQRRSMEEVFGCPVTNRYGCEEVGLIACECERHEGLHINADGVYVEIVRADGEPAGPGEAGSVVVTDLANCAMPILRYKIGDVAVRSERRCGCGRGLPLIERLEGREADFVLTPVGDLVSGISLTENFAVQVPGLAQLQIVQEAVDRFLFRIVRGPDFGPASLVQIHKLVDERFGPGVRYDCEYLDKIPQEPSGKYRFCISKVENPFTRPTEAAVR